MKDVSKGDMDSYEATRDIKNFLESEILKSENK
jgi:hypothetical protein